MTDVRDAPWAEVLGFWCEEVGQKGWFVLDPEVDAACAARFASLIDQAASGALEPWEAAPKGSLALLILLDQMPRNIHRGRAQAFAYDEQAVRIAAGAIQKGHDRAIDGPERLFFYTPFEHSERLEDQDRAVALLEAAGPEFAEGLKHARLHRDVIVRFGRFPHRNRALGREMTADEQAYLDGGGYAPGARPKEPPA